MDMSLSELQELVMDREAWRGVIHGIAKKAVEREPNSRRSASQGFRTLLAARL